MDGKLQTYWRAAGTSFVQDVERIDTSPAGDLQAAPGDDDGRRRRPHRRRQGVPPPVQVAPMELFVPRGEGTAQQPNPQKGWVLIQLNITYG